MKTYRKSAHATYRCEYHFVWVPKYRYKILMDDVKSGLQEVLTGLCGWMEIEILEGFIRSDHVYMYLSVPPKHSPSFVMKILKENSAEQLRKRFLKLRKRYWGLSTIWARGYFVSTVGLDGETIKNIVVRDL